MAGSVVMFDSSEEFSDYKLSRADILRGIVTEKLTTAAQEIFAVLERAVAGYEEEAAGLRQEIDRQRLQLEAVLQPRVSLSRIDPEAGFEEGGEPERLARCTQTGVMGSGIHNIFIKTENDLSEDYGGDVGEEESADESAKSDSPGLNITRERDDQTPDTRGPCLKRKRRKRSSLNLRVCLLEDFEGDSVLKCVFKHQVQEVKCPPGLEEADFLDLLRSTFPQLTGEFDMFTINASRELMPLNLEKLTPEEVRRSLRSTAEGTALFIREKDPGNSQTSTEQQSEQQSSPLREEEATNITTNDENWEKSNFNSGPDEELGGNDWEPYPSTSGLQQDVETELDWQQQEVPEHLNALYSTQPETGRDDKAEGKDQGDEETPGEPSTSAPPVTERDKKAKNRKKGSDDDDEEWKPDSEKELKPKKTRLSKKCTKKKEEKESADPVSCKVCKNLFRTSKVLIRHAWIHVEDPESLCGVCGEKSESAEELKNHLVSHGTTHGCDTCGKKFLSELSLQKHARLHAGEKLFKCDACDKTFFTKYQWRRHCVIHGKEKPHKCEVCDQSFFYKQQLKYHRSVHAVEKQFTCDVCGKSVNTLRSLSQHKLIHVGEKRYSCKVCEKRFLLPEKLKLHLKRHASEDKTYLCDVCSKMFHTQAQLNAHLKYHGEEKEGVPCTVCGKKMSKRNLRAHMKVHTGEKPHKCSQCEKSFSSTSHLKNHQSTHTGAKPFICGVCGKASARREHLRVHMRTHNGEKPYICKICNKDFTQSHCLKTHMKSH
ncbi:zinc finger protein 320-like [Cheilinus undulatus]|uniref:zinc finger protein 320-like n=1 Tax=Cheilinus undulatus TaxID=241271 RepID=UPI001BD43F7F|nr:zinc finger protein 320-like [Cheilinus undulatus]